MRTLATLLCLALLPAAARAAEVADVQVPDTATAGGQPLVLNGAGLRKKFIIKVYVGALYLPSRSAEPAAILASDAPWRVTMTFKRDVPHEKIVEAFRDGFEKNSPGEFAQHEASLKIWEAILQDLKEGQALIVTYLPGTGTTLEAPGGKVATVPGQPFGTAILRNWLGPHPADEGLKKALLGQ